MLDFSSSSHELKGFNMLRENFLVFYLFLLARFHFNDFPSTLAFVLQKFFLRIFISQLSNKCVTMDTLYNNVIYLFL